MAMGATAQWPTGSPAKLGSHCVWSIAMTAEHMARSEPTLRSMWRVTMTKTMPVAMMATETVWIVMLKMLRLDRKTPPVARLKARQISTKAPIIPRSRGSISSCARIPRRGGAPAPVWVASAMSFSPGHRAALSAVGRLLPGKAAPPQG